MLRIVIPRRTRSTDAALYYRQSGVVCVSVCVCVCLVTTVSSAKAAEPIKILFGVDSRAWAQGTVIRCVPIGATWRIRRIDPCGGVAATCYHYQCMTVSSAETDDFTEKFSTGGLVWVRGTVYRIVGAQCTLAPAGEYDGSLRPVTTFAAAAWL